MHNVRGGIYASEEERQRYENRDVYDSDTYNKDLNYRQINKEQQALKEQGKLHMQLATQSGVCVQYKTAQSYFVLYDAHCFVAQEYKRTMQSLQDEKVKYEQRQKVLNEELDGLERLTKQAKELICGIKGE